MFLHSHVLLRPHIDDVSPILYAQHSIAAILLLAAAVLMLLQLLFIYIYNIYGV